jgi:2-polyprenyl-3-methyl-5-hydroxy-6-metoxy-1,4-benzoquinol methylase
LEPYLQNSFPVTMQYRSRKASLVKCTGCGYLRFDPVPEPEFLAEYYADSYWNEIPLEPMARREYGEGAWSTWTDNILSCWKKYGNASRSPRIHDIGCGVGILVHHLRRAGANATGSDLSGDAIRVGRSLGNDALSCQSLSEFLAARPDERIDMFMMSHVLEHFRNPVSVLKEIAARLPADGVVWVRVPNGLYQGARARSWYDYHWLQYPGHIHYFTPRSLQCVFAAAGLTLCEIGTTTREDTPDLTLSDVFGRDRSELLEPHRMIEALAYNTLGMELQGVAVVGGRRRAESIDEHLGIVDPSVPATDINDFPVQNAAEFSLAQPNEGGWRYLWRAAGTDAFVPMADTSNGKAWKAPDSSEIGWSWVSPRPGSVVRLTYSARRSGNVRIRCATRIFEGDRAHSYTVRISKNHRLLSESVHPYYRSNRTTLKASVTEGEPINFDFMADNWCGRLYAGVNVEPLDDA